MTDAFPVAIEHTDLIVRKLYTNTCIELFTCRVAYAWLPFATYKKLKPNSVARHGFHIVLHAETSTLHARGLKSNLVLPLPRNGNTELDWCRKI